MNIIVCHPKYLSKLEKFNGKAILIDTRIEDYESLSRKFDRDKQIQIVKEFQNNISLGRIFYTYCTEILFIYL
mgnify:CR=1 FL=1